MEIENRVNEGMHRDFDEVNQPDNTYRDSSNGDIFEVGKGRYEWRPKTGNAVAFSTRASLHPYSFITLVTKLIVFSVDDLGRGEIGYVSLIDPRLGIYTPFYFGAALNFDKNFIIKGRGYKEAPGIERVYWRDGKNVPRTFNLFDIINTEDEPYVNSIVKDMTYLYIGDTSLTYGSGTAYPGDVIRSHVSFSVNTQLHKIVKYVPLEMLEWTPQSLGGNFEFKEIVSGGMQYGAYFFGYRLGLNSGYVTPWSNIIGPVNVLDFSANLFLGGAAVNPSDQYQNTQGKSHLLNSTYGIRLSFSNMDTNYDFIEILVLHCDQFNLVETPYIGLREEIANRDSFDVDIAYNHKFGLTSIAEISAKNIMIQDMVDIDILKKQMNIAGVTEVPELSIENKIDGVVIREELYPFPIDTIHGTFGKDSNTEFAMYGAAIKRNTSYQVSVLQPACQYEVRGNSGSVEAEGVIYAIGSVIIGRSGPWYHYGGGNAYPVPIIRIRKFLDRTINQSVYDNHELQFFYDYKDPAMALYGRGYWGRQNYRFGVLCYDKNLNPKFVRWIGDKLTTDRNSQTTIQTNLKSDHVSGEYHFGVFDGRTADGSLMGGSFDDFDYDQTMYGKILSLVIDNLDLTDIIDEIGGFSIVRSARERTIISEGFIEPTVMTSIDESYDHIIHRLRWRPNNISYHKEIIDGTEISERHPFWYSLIDPDKFFGKDPDNVLIEDDYIHIIRYMENFVPKVEKVASTANNEFRKIYFERTWAPTNSQPYYSIATVLYHAKAEINPDIDIYFDPAESINIFRNIMHAEKGPYEVWGQINEIFQRGVGGPCYVIKTDADGNPGYGFGYWPDDVGGIETHHKVVYLPVVQHMRQRATEYGGSTDFAIGSSTYYHVNHFQLVNAEFKDKIRKTTGGYDRYIVDGIQIFGGDCFVNIFDYKRTMKDEYTIAHMPSDEIHDCDRGEIIMIPLQTMTNLATRLGRHAGKTHSYETGLGNGIRYNDEEMVVHPETWEEFLVDDSYSSEQAGIEYPGYPEGLDTNNTYLERIRYSLKKIDGELYDGFRVFKSANYIDLNKDGGPVTNIIGDKDRLFYWQYLLCGYIPIEERAMNANSLGAYIQMGIGGRYERTDDISKFFGAQGKFSVTKVSDGFVFIDGYRKAFVHLGYDSGIQNEGIIKGLDNDLNAYLTNEVAVADNPFQGEGVFVFFAPNEHCVYAYIKKDGEDAMFFSYNTLIRKFTGFHPWPVKGVATIIDKLYTVNGEDHVYEHGIGDLQKFYGTSYPAYIEIIVNAMPAVHKAFLNGSLTGAEKFFDQVVYRTDTQEETDNVTADNEEYESRLGQKWLFTFPFTETGRLFGLYLSMKFISSGTSRLMTKLSSIKTKFTEWL